MFVSCVSFEQSGRDDEPYSPRKEVNTALATNKPVAVVDPKVPTKNIAGPPVYYPPGQELFKKSEESAAWRAGVNHLSLPYAENCIKMDPHMSFLVLFIFRAATPRPAASMNTRPKVNRRAPVNLVRRLCPFACHYAVPCRAQLCKLQLPEWNSQVCWKVSLWNARILFILGIKCARQRQKKIMMQTNAIKYVFCVSFRFDVGTRASDAFSYTRCMCPNFFYRHWVF